MKINKKITKTFVFAITLLSIVLGIQNVKAETVNLNITQTDWWYQRQDPSGIWKSWYLNFYDFNGRVAYCIEPGVLEGTDYSPSNFDMMSLTNEQKEKLMLIAYYGYEYPNHNTFKYRVATQSLLWETVGTSTNIYSSERWLQGTIYNIDAERNEIMRLVNRHYLRPSFNGTTVNVKVGEEITLTDTNNMISDYMVDVSNGAIATINGNTLKIKATKVGDISIYFKKKVYTNREYLVYYSSNHQTMLSSGVVDPTVSVLNVKSSGGKIVFNKIDKDTNLSIPSGEATLENAVYGIYDSRTDALISEVTTNQNGVGILEHLPYFGEFYLKEIKASNGYQLDPDKYYFESNISNIDNEVFVKEKVINRDIELTKVFASSDTGIMKPEANVEFGFYDINNNLYKKAITDSNGRIKINLIYGTYTVRQLTTTKNHEKAEDFKIVVSESGDTYYYTVANAEITARLKVVKIDSENGNIIAKSGIKFKIKNVDSNEYVCQTITYPSAKTLCDFETDENGILITPYPLNNGNYVLEEVDQVIDGYLWNDTSLQFSIGDESEFTNDSEFGILLQVSFENTAVKGSVEMIKYGEEVILTENGFVYNKIKLSNVKIGLYAKEDIFDNFHNLIYEKDSLIETLTTDEDGFATISNLYLGKYYLKEIETVNGHILDKSIYEFELKYKDQYTPVVNYNIEINNYLPKGNLEFTKVDFSTSEALPNTKIEIYTIDDELVFSGITNELGQIIINDLPIGDYYIIETEAPENYILNDEKMYFSIKENGEIVKSIMTNNKIIIEVPDTGLSDSKVFDCITIGLIVLGIGFIIYDKKKKK